MERRFPNPFERLPENEVSDRVKRCRQHLERLVPQAHGLLVLAQLNIYYFSGTSGAGILWLPKEGEPVLLIRRGIERARRESPLNRILPMRSYADIPTLCVEAGSPFACGADATVAVDMGGVLWSQAQLLAARLNSVSFISGDMPIKLTRMRKSPWELAKMREAGARQHDCLYRELPKRIRPGMSEWNIARTLQSIYLDNGHCGLVNITPPGRVALGSVAAGMSGLLATAFDGPLGVLGLHPAVPYMGDTKTIWRQGQLLTVDMAFSIDGYCTDKTQSFWGGNAPTAEVIRAHACCHEIQSRAAAMLVPGKTPVQIWEAALAVAEEAGYVDGFMGIGPERARYIGHGIGLEMDEYPPLAAKFDHPFEENVVLALEPKIALPDVGVVGIENTFLVTPRGGECLTGDAFELLQVN